MVFGVGSLPWFGCLGSICAGVARFGGLGPGINHFTKGKIRDGAWLGYHPGSFLGLVGPFMVGLPQSAWFELGISLGRFSQVSGGHGLVHLLI